MIVKNNTEMGAECLGFAGASVTWWRMKPAQGQAKPGWRQPPQITVLMAECTDENGYTPASSVNIRGTEALLVLRSAIDEALKYEAPKTEGAME